MAARRRLDDLVPRSSAARLLGGGSKYLRIVALSASSASVYERHPLATVRLAQRRVALARGVALAQSRSDHCCAGRAVRRYMQIQQ